MDTTTRVQLVSEDLSACRACLATNTKLYSISDGLEECFIQLMGVEYSDDDGLPQHLCAYCRMQLLKFSNLRARCHRSQQLLNNLLKQQNFLSTDDIVTIDRNYHKLDLNLVKLSVYSFNSLDKKKNIQVSDPCDDPFDDRDELPETDIKTEPMDLLIEHDYVSNNAVNQDINNVIREQGPKNLVVEIDGLNLGQICIKNLDTVRKETDKISIKNLDTVRTETDKISIKNLDTVPKETDKISLKNIDTVQKETDTNENKRKNLKRKSEEDKELKTKRMANRLRRVAGIKRNAKPLTKWQLQLRRAENNFLPNFDYAEFESKHDCKLKILTMEEQLEEIVERKQSSNYLSLDYKCDHCGRGFEFEQTFKNHMVKHNPNIGKFQCEVCHIYFRTRNLWLRHVDCHKMKFSCNMCGFITRSKQSALSHFLVHTGKVFKCQQCDATFNKGSSYYGHVRVSHPSKDHVCGICGDSFIGALGLKHHKARAHREFPKPKFECVSCGVQFATLDAMNRHTDGRTQCDATLKPCAECGAVFNNEESLKNHVDTEHLPVQYWCEECEQAFLSEASLETHHQRIHLRLKWPAYGRTREMIKERYQKIKERTRLYAQVVCEVCGAKFISNAALEKHQLKQCKRENNTEPYKCPICDKACITQRGLQMHMSSHTVEKPHKCSQCPQAFRQAGALKRHHKALYGTLHTGEKSHKCSQCPQEFRQAGALKRHHKALHGTLHTGENSHKCSQCPQEFRQAGALKRHHRALYWTLHTGEKPHKCSQCPQEFRQAGALKRHHRAVHLCIDTRDQCSYCGKYFSTPYKRKQHVKTVHLQSCHRRFAAD